MCIPSVLFIPLHFFNRSSSSMFANKRCGECGRMITGTQACVGAIGKSFHQSCFACVKCRAPCHRKFLRIETQGGASTKVACEACYEFLRTQGDRCAGCNDLLINCDFIKALGKNYHPEHFTCATCGKSVRDGYFAINDKPYCKEVSISFPSLPSPLSSQPSNQCIRSAYARGNKAQVRQVREADTRSQLRKRL